MLARNALSAPARPADNVVVRLFCEVVARFVQVFFFKDNTAGAKQF